MAVSTWSRDERDQDLAFALSFSAVDLDLDAADPAGLLEVAKVELVTEQAFGLSEHRADDVGFVDDTFGGNAGSDLVFRGVWVVGHVRFSSGWNAPALAGVSSWDDQVTTRVAGRCAEITTKSWAEHES